MSNIYISFGVAPARNSFYFGDTVNYMSGITPYGDELYAECRTDGEECSYGGFDYLKEQIIDQAENLGIDPECLTFYID